MYIFSILLISLIFLSCDNSNSSLAPTSEDINNNGSCDVNTTEQLARFVKIGNFVTDNNTSLTWQDNEAVQTVMKVWLTPSNFSTEEYNNTSGDTAVTYCSELVLDGYDDFRLPSIEELESIVDTTKFPTISSVFEFNAAYYSYWSSTTYASYPHAAWLVDFSDGTTYGGNKENISSHVRCVRDGKVTSSEIPDTTPQVFQSGDTWKGLVYETIISAETGRIWLDRNLGASQACTAVDNTACYGDYYQWGREADGHEKSDSTTTETLATDIVNVGAEFIIGIHLWTTADNNGALRSAKWSKTNGTSICPVGYRVPTRDEWDLEVAGFENNNEALSALKLPSSGYRSYHDGSVSNKYGGYGLFWSKSVDNAYSYNLEFSSEYAITEIGFHGNGFSVRCIKD